MKFLHWLTEILHYRHADNAVHLDEDYCGSCYGVPSPPNARKPGCCNTCEEVREAYAAASWAFGRGDGVEQCQQEHYGEHLDEQRREGCRIEGSILVNKVVGNFHFAPGKSFSNGNYHVHDLVVYNTDDGEHTFSHHIHSLRFGPKLPDEIADKFRSEASSGTAAMTNYARNPLDGTRQRTSERGFNFMYFIKVVSTAYLPLGWDGSRFSGSSGLSGVYGNGGRSIETNQYSVTSHKRNLMGGTDEAEGHKERLHARGGIPGVFFSYVSDLCILGGMKVVILNQLSSPTLSQCVWMVSPVPFASSRIHV